MRKCQLLHSGKFKKPCVGATRQLGGDVITLEALGHHLFEVSNFIATAFPTLASFLPFSEWNLTSSRLFGKDVISGHG